jgi:putative ABC transport system permease protein
MERDLDRELQFHLERQIEANLQEGLSAKEARRRALRDFGGVEKFKEECRETRPGTVLDQAWQDLRYGARVLRSNPGFTFVAVVCLALGIGATTAMFSVVSGVLLRPLPFPNPDRLMMVFAVTKQDVGGGRPTRVSGPDFRRLRSQNETFEELGALWGPAVSNLSGAGDPVRVRSVQVTASLFRAMGVNPVRGRLFSEDDQGAGVPGLTEGVIASPEGFALVSDRLWRSKFGADPELIGKIVRLNDEPFTLIGIMPAGFNFPDGADLWTPAPISATRSNAYLEVIGRLKSGVGLERAHADLDIIATQLALEFPASNARTGVKIVPLHEQLVGKVRPALLVFLGAVCFVLLIATANVANLLIARAALRNREIAVRSALGAGSGRIVRQLLTESLLLALVGGGLGLLLAYLILTVFLSTAPASIPRLADISIDPQVLAFTVLISIVTGVVFGIVPAIHGSKTSLSEALKESARATLGPTRHRLRSGLVIAETALALVLLIGAGLLSATFLRLTRITLGFQTDNTVTMAVDLPPSLYRTTGQAMDYLDRALNRIRTVPGVRCTAATNAVPLGNGLHIKGDFTIQGAPVQPRLSAAKLVVSPDYFQTVGIPLRQGRFFTEQDTQQAPGVIMISESLARAIWADGDALGKRIDVGFRGEMPREIVGIVGDTKQGDLIGPSFAIYQPYLQVTRLWQISTIQFVVQTDRNPAALGADLRAALQDVDSDLAVYDVKPMSQVVAEKVSDPRFYASLLGSFSVIALLLAAAGIYGLTSYSVNQRTHEIGVRVALGARRSNILTIILRKGLVDTISGILIGLVGAFALTRLLGDFLYGVTPTDPSTFVAISLLLAVTALVASYVPARRAINVDPMIALRQE